MKVKDLIEKLNCSNTDKAMVRTALRMKGDFLDAEIKLKIDPAADLVVVDIGAERVLSMPFAEAIQYVETPAAH
jgi:hypothetical protein